ncbi:hypothetical protein NGM37_44685, partial [Streptomyces sp. TRM76130]|nr:hypothetical protein [Streptomyces sp. TRM76130]
MFRGRPAGVGAGVAAAGAGGPRGGAGHRGVRLRPPLRLQLAGASGGVRVHHGRHRGGALRVGTEAPDDGGDRGRGGRSTPGCADVPTADRLS